MGKIGKTIYKWAIYTMAMLNNQRVVPSVTVKLTSKRDSYMKRSKIATLWL